MGLWVMKKRKARVPGEFLAVAVCLLSRSKAWGVVSLWAAVDCVVWLINAWGSEGWEVLGQGAGRFSVC